MSSDSHTRSSEIPPSFAIEAKEPTGGLAPAYFEAISMGLLENLPSLQSKSAEAVRECVTEAIQTSDFVEVTGPGANSKWKLRKRIELISEALASL